MPVRVSIRQHTSAYVSIRQHTSAYVSIRQHASAYALLALLKTLLYSRRVSVSICTFVLVNPVNPGFTTADDPLLWHARWRQYLTFALVKQSKAIKLRICLVVKHSKAIKLQICLAVEAGE